MLPPRDSFINALVRSKLSLRRWFRNWRRNALKKPWEVLSPSLHDFRAESDWKIRPRRPAELPAHLPDRNPLPLPLLLSLLFGIAFLIRVWTIAYPPSVVFDEVHFLRFIRAYYYGEYFFDIHPPLGKLVLLAVTYLFCGAPEQNFTRNGAVFNEQRYVPLRVTSAICGAAISPLTYLIGREIGLSSWASLFAASVQAFEHLAVIESRLILIDAQLMMWMAACLFCALRMWGRPPGKRWRLVIGTALTGAATLSVKWTSLTTPGLIALISLFGTPFPSRQLLWSEMGVAGAIVSTFYVIMFRIHFSLLPKSGRGDGFMRREFQATLIGNKFYDQNSRGPGFWRNFFYLNLEMYVANKGITARHRWESRWWQWIINQRGLLFYNESEDGHSVEIMEKIYLIVNPAVTLITVVSVAIFIALAAVWFLRRWRRQIPVKKSIERRRMHACIIRGTFLISGYFLNLLPYIEVERCTFLYHYLPALFYALLIVSNLIDVLPSLRMQRIVSILLIATAFIAFLFWKPWIYAKGMDENGHAARRVFGELWK